MKTPSTKTPNAAVASESTFTLPEAQSAHVSGVTVKAVVSNDVRRLADTEIARAIDGSQQSNRSLWAAILSLWYVARPDLSAAKPKDKVTRREFAKHVRGELLKHYQAIAGDKAEFPKSASFAQYVSTLTSACAQPETGKYLLADDAGERFFGVDVVRAMLKANEPEKEKENAAECFARLAGAFKPHHGSNIPRHTGDQSQVLALLRACVQSVGLDTALETIGSAEAFTAGFDDAADGDYSRTHAEMQQAAAAAIAAAQA